MEQFRHSKVISKTAEKMRERPPIRFKDVPLFVKIGILIAFFALPLPFFIFVALGALYYAFFITVKKNIEETPAVPTTAPSRPQPWGGAPVERKRVTEVQKQDITLETFQRPVKTPGSKDVICPQCGNKFYGGKPQVCHLSNCHYD